MSTPWNRSRISRKRTICAAKPRLEVLEERRLLSATPNQPLDEPIAEPLVLTGGAEFQVNTTTAGDQLSPRVTSFADGSFAVTWKRNDYPTFQRYDAAGSPVGSETQLLWTKGYASVAADGTSVVAYTSGSNLRARRHDVSGNEFGSDFTLNALPLSGTSGVQAFTDEVGNHTFVWHGSTTNPDMIYYRRFNASGTALTGQMAVGEGGDIYADMNPSGDLAIAYASQFALIKGTGEVLHSPLPNSTSSWPVYSTGVDITSAGNFAVKYAGDSFINVQRFDATGLPDDLPVNVQTTQVAHGRLLLEPGRDFVLVAGAGPIGYELGIPNPGRAVIAQRFDASGSPEPAFRVNSHIVGDQQLPSAVMLDSSTFVVAWQSAGQDGSGEGIFAKRFTDDDLPTVEFASPEEGPAIIDGQTLLSQVAGLRVAFSRPMNPSSVESLANWHLLDDGVDLSSLIAGVTYEHDVAYLTLTEPLRGTGYQLVVQDAIQDALGRAIDGDQNSVAGGAYEIAFSVRQGVFGVGAEQLIDGDAGHATSQSGIALNNDGSYAVAFAVGKRGLGIDGWEARVFDASGQPHFPSTRFNSPVGPMLPLQEGEFLLGASLGSSTGVISFDANGAGPLTQLNSNSFGYLPPYNIARAPDGTYIAIASVQSTGGPPATWDLRFQRFSADGAALGLATSIDQPAGGEQIFVFQNGEFVVAWLGEAESGTGYALFAQRFAADGSPIGEHTLVESFDRRPGSISIAGDRAGNLTIVWSDLDVGGSFETRFFARRFDSDGQPLGAATHFRSTLDDNHWTRRPLIAMDDSGRSLITWNEGPQLFVQAFAADGQPLTDAFQINTEPVSEGASAEIAMNSSGEAVLSWPHSLGGIRARRLSLGDFPVLDLNGAAEGIDFATDKDPGELLLPIVDAAGLTITTASPTLVGATIQMDSWLIGGELGIDTTGTNITATYSASGITLSGVDSVANYQQVLRTVVFAPPYSFEGGETTEIQFTIDDGAATSPIATARVRNTAPAEVLGRHLYYAGSRYDAPLPGGHYDNAAYHAAKTAYQAGTGLASFANVSSYTRGINGIVLFASGDYGVPTVNDFTFKMGTSTDPATWSNAPAPSAITFRKDTGAGGRDIIEITWPAGAIKNTWLEVTMLANPNTGLAANDVFYFGSRVGDTGLGNNPSMATTTSLDQLAARANVGPNAGINNPYDFDRSGGVTAADELASRSSVGVLRMLNLSVPAAAAPLVAAVAADNAASSSAVASALAHRGTLALPADSRVSPATAIAPATAARPLNAVALAIALNDETGPLAGIGHVEASSDAEAGDDDSLLDALLAL